MSVSGEIGYDKPRREIFEVAMRLAVHPDCCFFIGDNPIADGQGAANAGIHAMLVHTKEDSRGFPVFDKLTRMLQYMEGMI